MVEPLFHFAVPFVSLRAFGIDQRKALFFSLLALTPDIDVLFQVHRSQSHSFILLAIVVLPLLIFTWNRKNLRSLVLLGAFAVSTHLVLDLFQSYTPVLWPLQDESIWITFTLTLHMGSAVAVTGSATVLVEQTVIERLTSLDAPVLTGEGLTISTVLLAPTIFQFLLKRLSATK